MCSVPPFEELASALQKHDLFIYFGHGSGMLLILIFIPYVYLYLK